MKQSYDILRLVSKGDTDHGSPPSALQFLNHAILFIGRISAELHNVHADEMSATNARDKFEQWRSNGSVKGEAKRPLFASRVSSTLSRCDHLYESFSTNTGFRPVRLRG